MRRMSGRAARSHPLLPALLTGLLCLANQAMAGITYSMVGGECTDSNRPEVFYPDAIRPDSGELGVFGPGPTLCADHVAAEITMRDGYVPGTFFENRDLPGARLDVERFSFTDGAWSFSTTFPIIGRGLPVSGVLPEQTEPSVLQVFWHEGWFLQSQNDGTWAFGVEFGARNGVCGLGSVEGPDPTGEACTPTQTHYYSLGTYQGWQRVPEPPTVMILAVACAALAGLRHRSRKA